MIIIECAIGSYIGVWFYHRVKGHTSIYYPHKIDWKQVFTFRR